MNKKILSETKEKRVSIIEENDINYILKESFSSDEIEMLKNEVSNLNILKRIDCVSKLIKYKFSSDENYLICEYVEGRNFKSLSEYDIKEKVKYYKMLLEAVKKIHNNKIIHCDLKPNNIIIDKNNNIKIIDFGTSIIEGKKNLNYGTPVYCSLEQLKGQKLNVQTDIYSLGVILYQLLYNKLLYSGTISEIKKQKKYSELIKTNDILLDKIFFKTINNDLSIRYKNIDELENDFNKFYTNLDINVSK